MLFDIQKNKRSDIITFMKGITHKLFRVVFLFVILASSVAVSRVHAMDPFSGTGDGLSADTAYMITNCDQLQEMDHFLDAYFKLANDIDCSATNPSDPNNATSQWADGKGFNPIGDMSFNGQYSWQGFTQISFTGTLDGQNHSIKNLYIHRGSGYNDPDAYYIGLFRTIASGAAVKNLVLKDVSIYGDQNEVGALAGGLSGTVTNVSSSGTVHGNYRVGGLVGVHVSDNDFPNSSPLVYTWNGSKYVYTNDVGSLLPKELDSLDLASIDRKDLAPKNGKYLMKIGEEYNEIVYFDKLALMTFDHIPGYTVVEQLGKTSSLDQLRTVSDTPTNPLISCTDEKGANCTDALKAYDDKWSYSNSNNKIDPKNLKKSFVLDFGDLSNASTIQLVLRGARDYAASAQYPGNSARSIQVKDANGNWVEIYNKNQLGSDGTPRLRVVDLTGKFLSNDYHVKVSFDTFNANYFAVDTSAQVPFEAHTYTPDTVSLGYYGFSAIDRTHFYDHDFYKVSPVPDRVFKNQYGYFTKYGDVTPLLSSQDDHFVVMRYGDQLSVEFPYVAPVDPGMERSFILVNNAYYKHATYGTSGVLGQSSDYLPYQGMTSYGLDMTPYPTTPENTTYRNEWNTRYLPGPFADALKSGGSTVIDSHSSATVEGNDTVGGLVGENNNKEIRTSYFTGTVNGSQSVGGIAGSNFGSNGWVHDSYSTGTISGTEMVGGVVGRNEGKIERTYSSGSVSGSWYNTGGLVGYDYDWSVGIFDSFSTSLVTAPEGQNTGGFVGSSNNATNFGNNFWSNPLASGNGNSGAWQPISETSASYFQGTGLASKNPFAGKWDLTGSVWYMHPNAYPDFETGVTVVSGCTDHAATNYNASANTDDGTCTFPTPTPEVVSSGSTGMGTPWTPVTPVVQPVTLTDKPVTCPADQLLHQNLKAGARNGKYNNYTKAVVTEAKVLQAHMNRLGFNAGPVDGILGKLTDGAIKRMQKYLGTLQDGMVGPMTRGLINKSCGANGLVQ